MIKKFINIVFWVVLIVFLWMMATFAISGFDRTQMNFMGFAPNLTMSNSMEPTIMTGDVILTKRISFEDVEVGDIIVYKHVYEDGNYKAIVHRVIEKTDEYLICKGDNNDAPDPWCIYPDEVRAKVIWY